MKKIQFSALACLILSAAFLPSAFANHRTGSIIAPELLVAGDFNQDGNMDLAVNCTGFDVVAILFGDGQGGYTWGDIFPTDTLTKGLDMGDLNRDGHLDLVAATSWGYTADILLGNGLGAFHVPPAKRTRRWPAGHTNRTRAVNVLLGDGIGASGFRQQFPDYRYHEICDDGGKPQRRAYLTYQKNGFLRGGRSA